MGKSLVSFFSDSQCISPARRAHSSKPTAVALLWCAHAETDSRTDKWTDRQTDIIPFHRPCSAYYAGSAMTNTALSFKKRVSLLKSITESERTSKYFLRIFQYSTTDANLLMAMYAISLHCLSLISDSPMPWRQRLISFSTLSNSPACIHTRDYGNLFLHCLHTRGQDSPWKSQSDWQRTEINGESTSMAWPTLGSRAAKEQNRTLSNSLACICCCCCYYSAATANTLYLAPDR